MSLGVTFDRRLQPLRIRNGAELEAFLRRHRCLDELLGPDAEVLDFLGCRISPAVHANTSPRTAGTSAACRDCSSTRCSPICPR